jgi:hypothetical protein
MLCQPGIRRDKGGNEELLTPISASSLTDSRIVTWCSGFATFVEMAAARPARPAPMTMRWMDIVEKGTLLLKVLNVLDGTRSRQIL